MTRHGHYNSPTYSSWRAMISRCSNPHRPNYHLYGGRGISVCESWKSFPAFLQDMGLRPDGHQIDRINVDGNYEPSNCRWVTPKQNSNNRRAKIDLMTGKTFGKWVVLNQSEERDWAGGLKFLCQCECGHQTTVKKKALLDSTSSQCKNCAIKHYLKSGLELIGKKFNQWLVISVLDSREARGRIQYWCKCSCGFTSKMVRASLESGRSKSCRSCAAYNRPIKGVV